MKNLKLISKRIIQVLISSLASAQLMEKLFNELPDLNFIFVSTMLSIIIFVLLLIYEVPLKIVKNEDNSN